MMIRVSGFGEDGSTIAETVGAAKVYRGHFEGRLRKNSYVRQIQKNTSSERRNFMTALAIGEDDYRAALTMFFSVPLSAQQIAKERRRAEDAGLGFHLTDVVMREDIESAAPPSLTINMDGIGTTGKTNTWTSSGWPTWWQAETTYAFSDGRELAKGKISPLSLSVPRNGKPSITKCGTRGSYSMRISGNVRKTLISTLSYGWQIATGSAQRPYRP